MDHKKKLVEMFNEMVEKANKNHMTVSLKKAAELTGDSEENIMEQYNNGAYLIYTDEDGKPHLLDIPELNGDEPDEEPEEEMSRGKIIDLFANLAEAALKKDADENVEADEEDDGEETLEEVFGECADCDQFLKCPKTRDRIICYMHDDCDECPLENTDLCPFEDEDDDEEEENGCNGRDCRDCELKEECDTCEEHEDCEDCPLYGTDNCIDDILDREASDEDVDIEEVDADDVIDMMGSFLTNGIRIQKNEEQRTTTVMWGDGTVTKVCAADGETMDNYHAFTAALANRILGSNSRINRIVEQTESIPGREERKAAEKARKDVARKRHEIQAIDVTPVTPEETAEPDMGAEPEKGE